MQSPVKSQVNQNKPQPELIIFDCDGVLIDSEIISATTLIDLLQPLGLAIDLHYIQHHFLGRSFPTVAAIIREEFELDLPYDFEASYRKAILQRFDSQLNVTPGICTMLDRITHRICVATSSSPPRVERCLQITGLNRYFDGHIYTASQVKNGKPAPDLFLHVAESEGVDPSACLVIEDSAPGVEAAVRAGMAVWRYLGGSHFDTTRQTISAEEIRARVFDSWSDFFDMMNDGAYAGGTR